MRYEIFVLLLLVSLLAAWGLDKFYSLLWKNIKVLIVKEEEEK